MKVADYLKSRGTIGEWTLEGCQEVGFAGAVVIPALAESANLMATLNSLASCPADILKRFLVVIVVNNRPDAISTDVSDNLSTLENLPLIAKKNPSLNIAWIDAASQGRELPLKGGGVGMARKIGADCALTRLDTSCDGLLIYLDADTLVRNDYLTALESHFQHTTAGAATIPFVHQPAVTIDGQRAIDRYELFLRSYVYGLSLAKSPYAFHSVGSAMACRASAYMKIGGMNCRQAGEDFYFLQQLSRVVGVSQLSGTVVYPSARASHRVPFGTGRAVSRTLIEGEQTVLFYQQHCFRILGEWLALITTAYMKNSHEIMSAVLEISSELGKYLVAVNFTDVWQKLQKNHPKQEPFIKAFHDWFDGLKTMKMIHYFSDDLFPRCQPDEALKPLFIWGGISFSVNCEEQLEALRMVQLGMDL